jgi:hypothetical protein
MLEELEVPDEVATLSLGASSIPIQVCLWDVHIFQFGSNVGKVGGRLWEWVAACMVLCSTRLVMFWRYLTTHMEVKALALSTRDHTKSPPSFLGSLSIALATLGMPPFQMKDCTRAFILLRAGSHPGAMPAWCLGT